MSFIVNPNGRRMQDLTGRKFGRLVVVSFTGRQTADKRWMWLCTKSCGCFQREHRKASGERLVGKNKTHGMKRSPEYRAWRGMKSRCHNPSSEHYQYYGAKGVTVCEAWRSSFTAFYQHIGPKTDPTHSVERIDCTGNYEPGNVKWGTEEEQANNRRDSVRLTAFGETMTVAQWARKLGQLEHRIYARLKYGWGTEDALTFTVGRRTRWKRTPPAEQP